MNWEAVQAIAELAAATAVLLSLGYLAIQIRQNTVLVRAQLESDATAGWIEIDASKQSEGFAEVLAKAIEAPNDLTLGEMVELDGYLFTYIEQLVRHRRQLELGLTDRPLEDLIASSIYDFFGNRYAQAWWAVTSHKWSPSLVATIDRHLASVSPDQDREYYDGIRARLQHGG